VLLLLLLLPLPSYTGHHQKGMYPKIFALAVKNTIQKRLQKLIQNLAAVIQNFGSVIQKLLQKLIQKPDPKF
jgi:hypothetical protein